MKLHGVTHDVILDDGRVIGSQYPHSREDAIKEGIALWQPMPPVKCPRPLHGCCLLLFVISGVSLCCAQRDSVDAYREARANGEPTTPGQAQERGLDYYWVGKHGTYCGHLGKRTIAGKCWYCEQAKRDAPPSPRQIALAAGATWYDPAPGDVCPAGHQAPRRVANGSCQQCEQEQRGPDNRRTPATDVDIRALCPELVINRDDARTAGFTVFRTGESCKRGHFGWRYISTGGCIDCKEGR